MRSSLAIGRVRVTFPEPGRHLGIAYTLDHIVGAARWYAR